MLKKLKNIKKLISNTPLVEIECEYNGKIKKIYVKCDWFSLTGSVKDKPAFYIIYDLVKRKILKQTDNLVEVSSGNMGISLTAIANMLGIKTTIIMPKTMSEERKHLMRLYGAELVLVDNFKQAFKLCDEYVKKGYIPCKQFENNSNFSAHYNITGEEVFKKLKNKNVNNFIAGIGTSGTLSGTGAKLKEKMNLKVVAIEPENARIITGKYPLKKHKLQGLSDEILPKLYNKDIVDSVIQISDNDAIAMSQKLCKELSLGVGISSGANFLGAVLSKGNSVTIFPDDNKKYLSTDLTKPVHSQIVEEIKLISIKVL